jgi:hypothetical protein
MSCRASDLSPHAARRNGTASSVHRQSAPRPRTRVRQGLLFGEFFSEDITRPRCRAATVALGQ